MMYKSLYCDNVTIDDQNIFYDLDMAGNIVLQHVRVVRNPDMTRNIKINDTVTMDDRDICHILAICDKLALYDTIDKILVQHTTSPIPYSPLIINHSLSHATLIKLYAKTGAYNLLHGYRYYGIQNSAFEYNNDPFCDVIPDERQNTEVEEHDHDAFRDATLNGLRITSLNVRDKFVNDNHIQHCTALTILAIRNSYCKITTCAPFAKSLKVLCAEHKSEITDKSLELCTSIAELYVSGNRGITTCEPFANTLEVLNVSKSRMYYFATRITESLECGIGDIGIASCHSIKKLIAHNNERITTCAPFAKTLIILDAPSECGIGDDGLALCISLEGLRASHNHKITTCAPFANCLKYLEVAGESCGIDDKGIALCHSIVHLDAKFNTKITTCAPFAHSLKYLYASSSGINDDGIASCHSIIKLNTQWNSAITTCAPFAKSLRYLDASNLSGINDRSIATCHFIKWLSASDNPLITTCAPFAKSLRHLYARRNCGIDTKGILPCESLVTFYADSNDKIDRSKITMAKK